MEDKLGKFLATMDLARSIVLSMGGLDDPTDVNTYTAAI